MDKTKSGLCLVAGLGVSSIESLGSVITVFSYWSGCVK